MQSIVLRSWPPGRRSPSKALLFFSILKTNRENKLRRDCMVTFSGVLSAWQQVTVLTSFENVNALSKKSTDEQLVELPNRGCNELVEQFVLKTSHFYTLAVSLVDVVGVVVAVVGDAALVDLTVVVVVEVVVDVVVVVSEKENMTEELSISSLKKGLNLSF